MFPIFIHLYIYMYTKKNRYLGHWLSVPEDDTCVAVMSSVPSCRDLTLWCSDASYIYAWNNAMSYMSYVCQIRIVENTVIEYFGRTDAHTNPHYSVVEIYIDQGKCKTVTQLLNEWNWYSWTSFVIVWYKRMVRWWFFVSVMRIFASKMKGFLTEHARMLAHRM